MFELHFNILHLKITIHLSVIKKKIAISYSLTLVVNCYHLDNPVLAINSPRVSCISVLQHPTRKLRAMGAMPIRDSDFFEFPYFRCATLNNFHLLLSPCYHDSYTYWKIFVNSNQNVLRETIASTIPGLINRLN